ncbi:hypothetical protein FB451DRAFT_1557156 [Mycena latifolia]|nr:hypothetical protein FB451DRAFT_1557156 [Mycena latifolia]
MSGDDFDDSGYGSDTGPRDNPRCSNFENDEPVKTGFSAAPRQTGSHTRALNRTGRAICRIVHAHGWTQANISKIFRVPPKQIRKALQNTYAPPDNTGEDYDYVDSEYTEKFPPVQDVSRKPSPDSESAESSDDDNAAGDSDNDFHPSASVNKRPSQNQIDNRTVKKPRYGPLFSSRKRSVTASSSPRKSPSSVSPPPKVPKSRTSLPLPRRASLPMRSPELLAFLKNVLGLDFSKHIDLFTERGLGDMNTLCTMATWERAHLSETLKRVLMGTPEELGGRKGLTALEVVSLELAIRPLK